MGTIDTLNIRVARLERRNRLLGTGLLCVLLLGCAAALQPPATLRASGFELVDSRGHVLAELGFRDGSTGLFIRDGQGGQRAALTHNADSTGLYIRDGDDTVRIGVAQFAHGGGGVALHGPQSRGAAVLYLKKNGSLRFFDAKGQVVHAIVADELTP